MQPQIVPRLLEGFWYGRKIPDADVAQTWFYFHLSLTIITLVDVTIKGYEVTLECAELSKSGESDSTFSGGILHRYQMTAFNRFSPEIVETPKLQISSIESVIATSSPLGRSITRDGWIAVPIDIHHVNAYDPIHVRATVVITDSFSGRHQSDPTHKVIQYAQFTTIT